MKRFPPFFALAGAFAAALFHTGGVWAVDVPVEKRPAFPAPSAASSKANYLSELHGVHRWRKLPVRVFFRRDGAHTPEREQAAREGFDEWTNATGGIIGYAVVQSEKQADVIVRFTPASNVPPDPNALGVTAFATRGPYLEKAIMTLATGGRSTLPELTEVSAHEWGHALGINGHSATEGDIMYAVTTRYISLDPDFTPPAPRIVNRRDLNTLKAIYPSLFK